MQTDRRTRVLSLCEEFCRVAGLTGLKSARGLHSDRFNSSS